MPARIELPRGAILFREGDPPDSAFLVECGEIEVISGSDDAAIALGRLGPGDLLGEMAVMDGAPRTATARAVTDCVLTPLAREQLNERIEAADPVVRALLRGQLQRYRSALHRLRGLPGRASNDAVDRGLAQRGAADGMAKIRLESRLRAALDRGALDVLYQPVLEIATGRVAGYEALVRWSEPDFGPLDPGEFIRVAEETSLIVPVGRHVFAQACATLARLRGRGVEPLPFVAVNVSARQLAGDDVLGALQEIAAAAGVAPSAISIEITESLALDVEAVAALIARAHAAGVRVALDDFGTGFSNLGHLHRLNFDTLKLDRMFTGQLLCAPRCHAIVQAVSGMAAALGADLLAEGVETEPQLDALRAIGCRYAQGWLVGRPASAEAIVGT